MFKVVPRAQTSCRKVYRVTLEILWFILKSKHFLFRCVLAGRMMINVLFRSEDTTTRTEKYMTCCRPWCSE